MKKIFSAAILMLFYIKCFSQTVPANNLYLKLSGGRVVFGTGDILGYSFGIDLSKDVIKKQKPALKRLLIGAEFIFENGVRNPVIINPTVNEFFSQSFYQTSNSVLWPKASYYPFKNFIRGFNIQLGPTVGYTYSSKESRSSRMTNLLGESVRQSVLSFDNNFTIGYRISTGIEINVTKKILTGFRLDWSNNNRGNINTLLGLKLGMSL
ncbi:MAG: hypothetical protein K2X48_08415 [Chitinophagaceae bacterium]|nr:hypothetical protein [Chitinophagaceae bacterium]